MVRETGRNARRRIGRDGGRDSGRNAARKARASAWRSGRGGHGRGGAGDGRATYRKVLAEPRFRVLFVTRSLVIAADTLRMVALSVLVYARTQSPLLAAVAFGAGFVPQVAGGALLGALADRMRPRLLVAGVFAANAAAAGLLGLADPPVAVALAVVAVVACAAPLMSGAVFRVMAEVLPGERYVLGRSLVVVSSSVAQLAGLAFGGVAVAGLGARRALLVACGVYAVAAVLVRVRLEDLPPAQPHPPAGPGTPGASPAADSSPAAPPSPASSSSPAASSSSAAPSSSSPSARTGEGAGHPGRRGAVLAASWSVNRLLLRDRAVRALLLAQCLPAACAAGAEGLLIPYARVRGYGEGTGAFLLACLPAGMLAGTVVVGRVLGAAARERLVVPLMLAVGMPLLPLAAGLPAVAAGALLAVAGAGSAYEVGLQRRFVDAVPPPVRGQAFGVLSTGLMTVQGVGPMVFGAVAEATGVGAAIASAGAATVAVVLWLRGALAATTPSAAAPS